MFEIEEEKKIVEIEGEGSEIKKIEVGEVVEIERIEIEEEREG